MIRLHTIKIEKPIIRLSEDELRTLIGLKRAFRHLKFKLIINSRVFQYCDTRRTPDRWYNLSYGEMVGYRLRDGYELNFDEIADCLEYADTWGSSDAS